jgi:hypothetical protein
MSIIRKALRGLGMGLGRSRASKKLRAVRRGATSKPSLKSKYGAKTPRTSKDIGWTPSSSKDIGVRHHRGTSVTYDPDLLSMNLIANDFPVSQMGRAAKGLPMHTQSTIEEDFGRALAKLVGRPIPKRSPRGIGDYVEGNVKEWLDKAGIQHPVHERTWETFAGAAHDQSVSLRKFFNESARITGQSKPDSQVVTDMIEGLARSHGRMSGPRDALQNPFEGMQNIVHRALEKQKRPELRVSAMNKYHGPSFDAPSMPGPRGHLNTPAPSLKLDTEFNKAMIPHGGTPSEVTLKQFGKPLMRWSSRPMQLSERLRSFKKQKAKTRAKKAAQIGMYAAAAYGTARSIGSTRKGRE